MKPKQKEPLSAVNQYLRAHSDALHILSEEIGLKITETTTRLCRKSAPKYILDYNQSIEVAINCCVLKVLCVFEGLMRGNPDYVHNHIIESLQDIISGIKEEDITTKDELEKGLARLKANGGKVGSC